MEVTARTWCRVDFAGGTLDIWPLGLLHPGAVTVNLAIDVATEVTLRPSVEENGERLYRLVTGSRLQTTSDLARWMEDPETRLVAHLGSSLNLGPAEIELRSASPRGGGLGASSALAVAFIVAAEAYSGMAATSFDARCRLAHDIEARMMSLPTGRQDHMPALLGGLLEIEHRPGGERIRSLDVDLDALGRSLIVVYSGQSHFSAGNNWRVVRGRLDGEPEAVRNFEQIARTARKVVEAFDAGDLARVGALMSREWSYRRRLAEGISTPRIESILESAINLGAWGGKACGAGGGGCVAILAPPERRDRIASAIAASTEVLSAAPAAGPFELRIE